MGEPETYMIYGIPFDYNDLVKFFKQFDPRKIIKKDDKKKIPGSKKTKKTVEIKGKGIKKPEAKKAKSNEPKKSKKKKEEETEENVENDTHDEEKKEEEDEENEDEECSGEVEYGDHPFYCASLEDEACSYFEEKYKLKFDYKSSCSDFPDPKNAEQRKEQRWFIGHELATLGDSTHIIPDKELIAIMDKYRPALFEISKEYGLKQPAMCMVWYDNSYY